MIPKGVVLINFVITNSLVIKAPDEYLIKAPKSNSWQHLNKGKLSKKDRRK